VRERAISVIAEYVPTSHSPDSFVECRKVKQDSKLKEDTLLSTRWIKPLQRVMPHNPQ